MTTGTPPPAIDRARLGALVEPVLRGRAFARSEQLKAILAFLCAEVVEGREAGITEALIGETILRRKNFDPNSDTIVRVQMRRLRQKLEEHYQEEGAGERWRIELPRHSYVPQVREVDPAPAAAPAIHAPVLPARRGGFWTGCATGAVAAAVLAAALWLTLGAGRVAGDPALQRSPFWSGFADPGARPLIAVATPLFFRAQDSYYRDYRLNFQEDLQFREKWMPGGFAWPVWNNWVSLSDVESAVTAQRLIASLGGGPVEVRGARQVTADEMRDRSVLFLGHPRGSGPLLERLAGLPFTVERGAPGAPIRGIVNRQPRTGEPARYAPEADTSLDLISENHPDHALVTLVRHGGRSLLSVFGNRYASTYHLVRRIADPAFLAKLEPRVFAGGPEGSGVQVVFQVTYLNGQPVDANYVTHRTLPPGK